MCKKIQLADNCVHCGEDTSFGSGRFVNRIPADADYGVTDATGNVIYAENEYRDGYSCAECMMIECDRCGQSIALDEDIGADDCGLDEFKDGAWKVHEECLTSSEKRSTDEEIEENCECGVSETTGKWSDDAFDLDGCTCR